MQNNPLLRIDSVSYQINKKTLVNNVSLEVFDKDVVSIIGPNGAGKSTLIKLLSGEINPTSGSIFFHGKEYNLWDLKELACFRSVLPQSNHLTFPFSVLDIVKMGRYPLSDSSDYLNDERICKIILDEFDLNDYINQNYITLSGGEKQRVQLARVLAQIWSDEDYSSKVLILDEPTSYLDIKHQYALFDFLKELNVKGLSIIFVLHDISQAILNSSKIAILKDSDLIKYGKREEIINSDLLTDVFNVEFQLESRIENNKPIIYL
ncbi:MAG: heme ABC transporter ATP-binding protein [Candidatus Marinimicrobia bacterium]|nr:heme ABC transporter ATP-binding protein [Candidatus Neomarinimicrobiota bacterium]|tara:strand:- start:6967 stop:7758 length:792 start_codon:yes stop_codon:yes gene_type:complete